MSSRTVRVYIAGPYSTGYVVYNTRHAMRMWHTLWCHGYIPICPHWTMFQDMLTPMAYPDWLEYDWLMLETCHVVLRLKGESDGADTEVTHAKNHSIPVVYSLEQLLKEFPSGEPATRQDSPA